MNDRRPDRGPLYLFRDMEEVDITDGKEDENPYAAKARAAQAKAKQGKGGAKKK